MDTLQKINEAYKTLVEQKALLLSESEAVAQRQAKVDQLETDIADLLASVGMSSLKMSDGSEVTLTKKYFVSTAQDRMDGIMAQLEEDGAFELAKPKKLKISEADIPALPDSLSDRVQYEVNTNSLKSHVKELDANGKLTPKHIELFAVHIVNELKVQ